MRLERVLSALAALTLVVTVQAQQNTPHSNVAVDAGYVASKNAMGSWQGMTDVAANASIDLNANTYEGGTGGGTEGGGPSGSATFSKFSTASGTPTSNTYSTTDTTSSGTAKTGGTSTVTDSGTAPTYYSAPWGATSSPTPSTSGGTCSTGTYDPWSITRGSLSGLGNPVDLYYQTGLLVNDPIFGTTGIGFGSGSSASYGFQTYAYDTGASYPFFLTINFNSSNGLSLYFDKSADFDVYLLGANATDPNADPSARTGANDAQALNANNFDAILRPLFDVNGAPSRDLNFGILRHYTVSGSGADGDVLFEWHTNTSTFASAAPVPEPSALAALGLGALAVLRRRRR